MKDGKPVFKIDNDDTCKQCVHRHNMLCHLKTAVHGELEVVLGVVDCRFMYRKRCAFFNPAYITMTSNVGAVGIKPVFNDKEYGAITLDASVAVREEMDRKLAIALGVPKYLTGNKEPL